MARKLTPAEIQTRFTDDILFLEGQGVDVSKIKTPAYAHRRAQAIRRALAENRPVPSVKEQRGKTGGKRTTLPITHLPHSGHLLEQYQIEAKHTPKRELTYANLAYLLNNSPVPKQPYYSFVIAGVVDTLSPLDQEAHEQGLVERTYSYKADKVNLAYEMQHANPTDETYPLWHFLRPDIKWLHIALIGIAYPK
jgi:hypothetical protein